MNKKSQYHILRESLIKKHKEIQKSVWDKHSAALTELIHNTKQFAVGSASAVMMLTSPHMPLLSAVHDVSAKEVKADDTIGMDVDPQLFYLSDLRTYIPDEVRALTADEEASISAVLSRDFQMKVVADINGLRLDRSYGYIGAEQHLARYPGDTMESHFENPDDAKEYWSSGMAPGLGAWRYFADSRETMTQKESDREKYYIAVQTFLSKDYHTRHAEYRDFYKFRKMLVVNPNTGRAIVTVVGDAGPAPWTGKHLGGSPEVMRYLERVDGRGKGPVIYMFIDDPEDQVPLGPIEVKK